MINLRGSLLIALLIATAVPLARAQNGFVRWSAIDAGYGSPSTSGTRLASVLGQAFVGSVRRGNSTIQGGFLAGIIHPLGISSVDGHGNSEVPLTTSLLQNYPNPFNPLTIIKYTVGVANGRGQVASVKLVVYDLLGREVKVLVNEQKQPGNYLIQFDGSGLASGAYFYRLTVGSFVATKKLLLVK